MVEIRLTFHLKKFPQITFYGVLSARVKDYLSKYFAISSLFESCFKLHGISVFKFADLVKKIAFLKNRHAVKLDKVSAIMHDGVYFAKSLSNARS